MRQAGLALIAFCLAGAAPAGRALTREDAQALEPNGVRFIESCVSDERLQFLDGDRSALLDAADRKRLGAAMLSRYPVLARDGFEPAQILLWQRRTGELLYVTLLANPARPAEACFTASFAAGVFQQTRALLRKYLHDAQPQQR